MTNFKRSLTEWKGRDITLENGVRIQDILVRGGKTGRKVHIALSGSSCLGCGHWCKHVVNNWKLTAVQADKLDRCVMCFGPEWLERVE